MCQGLRVLYISAVLDDWLREKARKAHRYVRYSRALIGQTAYVRKTNII